MFKKNRHKKFIHNGEERTFKFLSLKTKGLEIWLENDRPISLFKHMPHAFLLENVFIDYRNVSGLKYKYVLITDELKESDNWFYKRNKTWIITMRGVLEIIMNTLEKQGHDIRDIQNYLNEKEVVL